MAYVCSSKKPSQLTPDRYDSIPTDTLLNLGFAGGEGMAEDFFAICENPDPVDMVSLSPSQQTEDEETVWRRLVMRGRFV